MSCFYEHSLVLFISPQLMLQFSLCTCHFLGALLLPFWSLYGIRHSAYPTFWAILHMSLLFSKDNTYVILEKSTPNIPK